MQSNTASSLNWADMLKKNIPLLIIVSVAAVLIFMVLFPKHWLEASIISPIPPII